MIAPEKILALFDEPHKNQGLILHYAYQAMPDLAVEVIRLREIEKAAKDYVNVDMCNLNCWGKNFCASPLHCKADIYRTRLKQALEGSGE